MQLLEKSGIGLATRCEHKGLTYSLLYRDGHFVDESFARWCSDHNTTWNDSNFFISGDVNTLSNCPMSGDTKIVYWSNRYKKFVVSPIKTVYHNKEQGQEPISVLSNGKLIDCRINRFDIAPEYHVQLVNGTSIKTTGNHLNKVLGKDYVQTKDLTTDDYLPYTLTPYKGTDSMSYEDGKIVGMFLGDGSYRSKHDIVFSLNNETDKDDIIFVRDYCIKRFNAKVSECIIRSDISGRALCSNICVVSPYLRGLISQFVEGDNALNKAIDTSALSCSMEFRRGIIDGLYTTDGGNSNRIYTSSEDLKDSLVLLFASMGIPTTVREDNREGRLGKNTSYTIRWYTPEGRTKREGVYKIEDGMFWFKIESISKLPNTSRTSYCLEVIDSDEEPVFMLANGVHTHNCRLLSDTTKLNAFINSIGGTALSIGSVKVNTINLMRIALETECDERKYLALLKKRAILCCKTLDIVRHIIKRNIEKGLLPNYQDGAVEMDKQYSTMGILGLFEVIDEFGYTKTDEFGYVSYTDEGIAFASKIFEVLNEVKDSFAEDYSFNIESVPKVSGHKAA